MTIPISSTLSATGVQSIATGSRPDVAAARSAGADTTQVQHAAQQPQPQQPADKARVDEAVDTINHKLQETNQQLRFAVDHDSGKMVVRVVDTATDQTIRQIPSEVAIAISQSLEKLQGLLVRQQA